MSHVCFGLLACMIYRIWISPKMKQFVERGTGNVVHARKTHLIRSTVGCHLYAHFIDSNLCRVFLVLVHAHSPSHCAPAPQNSDYKEWEQCSKCYDHESEVALFFICSTTKPSQKYKIICMYIKEHFWTSEFWSEWYPKKLGDPKL